MITGSDPGPTGGRGMVLIVNSAQAFAADVRVDLRGPDVGVSEHELQRAQVGAPLQKMRGEGVADHVGREPSANPTFFSATLEDLPKPLASHAGTRTGQKDPRPRLRGKLGTTSTQVPPEPLCRGTPQRNDPFFSPLAPTTEVSGIDVEVVDT